MEVAPCSGKLTARAEGSGEPATDFVRGAAKPSPYAGARTRRNGCSAAPHCGRSMLLQEPSSVRKGLPVGSQATVAMAASQCGQLRSSPLRSSARSVASEI